MSCYSTGGCRYPVCCQPCFPSSPLAGNLNDPQAQEPPRIAGGGIIAAGIPVGPGLALAIAGRPGALPFFAIAAVVVVVTGILSMAATMYQARQETLRMQIRYHGMDTFSAALARCIDDGHVKAQNLTGDKEIEEAERVRASARQLVAGLHHQPPH